MKKRSNRSDESCCRSSWIYPKPLQPQNKLQAHYLNCIYESPITIATGYPGTGKTYIPARAAADLFKRGEITNITLIRLNITSSKSVGYFPGTKNEKMSQWLAPVLGALREEFSNAALNQMMAADPNQVTMCPLELIKGLSLNDTFVIVDEAEDLTLKEIKAILTRIGQNSKIILCGDLQQSDLHNCGLNTFLDMRENDDRLMNLIGCVDFNDKGGIVRSAACKEVILGFERAGM